MIYAGQPFSLTFASLTTLGADNSEVTPTMLLINNDGTYAATTNGASHIVGAVWSIDLTGEEMLSPSVTVAWSGDGLVSGCRQIIVEGGLGAIGTPFGVARRQDVQWTEGSDDL